MKIRRAEGSDGDKKSPLTLIIPIPYEWRASQSGEPEEACGPWLDGSEKHLPRMELE